ncbi:thermostable hemolysin [Novosphingobium sp. BL-52-GroH]|uniref:thermostable hemolysin n=1 Tax=Novosphingobium sp. BL-52-GroH TaxID=3349877 RepID=UPI00384DDBBE
MAETSAVELVSRRYREMHGAQLRPAYPQGLHVSRDHAVRASVGYRRAGDQPLFLERYLDRPVEARLAEVLGRSVARDSVIEIGHLAADDAFAMVSLWGLAANDLGGQCEIAVATLTAQVRSMFVRLGVQLHVLAAARADRVGDAAAWGRYYENDPQVCAGGIAQGQQAIARFLARRGRITA